jgi:hypothetical protein
MKSPELLEEIERLQYEHGPVEVQIPDPVERWCYPVDRVEWVPEAQAIRLVSDH